MTESATAPSTVLAAGALPRVSGGGATVDFVDVTRTYGAAQALDGLSLSVGPGELLALLGPSGCGKTTALRILAGFDHPTSGSVLVGGRDITRLAANRRQMGMVFQSYSLFPTMSALENVAYGLRVRRRPAEQRRRRAGELMELVGLAEHLHKYPHQLSGGQQQRVALARALAITPQVLLLDEPLSALDAKVREQLRDEIRRIQVEMGVTTVFVTHDQEEALSMADRVGVMRAGRLEQCSTPAELYARPATAFVAQFVGTMNRVVATAEHGQRVRLGEQSLPVLGSTDAAVGQAVTILVRPEAVVVTPRADADWFVALAKFRGATTRLRLVGPGGAELLADMTPHLARDLQPGTRVAWRLQEDPVLVDSSETAPGA